MTKKQIIKKTLLKKKKKIWIPIYASDKFNNAEIGESLVEDVNFLLNKTISVNGANLTGDLKKQNVKLVFFVDEIRDNRAISKVVGYEMVSSFIRRIVRKARSKVEDSLILTTQDNVKVRIKPLILTKTETKSSILKAIRRAMIEFLNDLFKKTDYEDILLQLINHSLQFNLKASIKKIYPIGLAEIRVLKRLK